MTAISLNPAATAGSVRKSPDQERLETTAKAFEAVFLREMMKTMRAGSLSDDIMGSSATDSFRELADARTADEMAETRSFGIADLLIRQLGGVQPVPITGASTDGKDGQS